MTSIAPFRRKDFAEGWLEFGIKEEIINSDIAIVFVALDSLKDNLNRNIKLKVVAVVCYHNFLCYLSHLDFCTVYYFNFENE